MRVPKAGIALAGITLLIAGCGGGSAAPGTTTRESAQLDSQQVGASGGVRRLHARTRSRAHAGGGRERTSRRERQRTGQPEVTGRQGRDQDMPPNRRRRGRRQSPAGRRHRHGAETGTGRARIGHRPQQRAARLRFGDHLLHAPSRSRSPTGSGRCSSAGSTAAVKLSCCRSSPRRSSSRPSSATSVRTCRASTACSACPLRVSRW